MFGKIDIIQGDNNPKVTLHILECHDVLLAHVPQVCNFVALTVAVNCIVAVAVIVGIVFVPVVVVVVISDAAAYFFQYQN
jgi:hypothetical protein